jgi:hypothetical protein
VLCSLHHERTKIIIQIKLGLRFCIVLASRLGPAVQATAAPTSSDDKEANRLETMTMANFLEATRLGSAMCVVDGRVLDIHGCPSNSK